MQNLCEEMGHRFIKPEGLDMQLSFPQQIKWSTILWLSEKLFLAGRWIEKYKSIEKDSQAVNFFSFWEILSVNVRTILQTMMLVTDHCRGSGNEIFTWFVKRHDNFVFIFIFQGSSSPNHSVYCYFGQPGFVIYKLTFFAWLKIPLDSLWLT